MPAGGGDTGGDTEGAYEALTAEFAATAPAFILERDGGVSAAGGLAEGGGYPPLEGDF